MEARRIINSALLIIFVLITITALLPQKAQAWGNVGAHPEINRLAVILFQQQQVDDSALKNISLNGEPCWGIAWDPSHGNALVNRIEEKKRQKTLKDWIVDAGYSADEPEGPMAMRHFYDPTNSARSYLSDTDWVAGFLRLTLGSIAVNPEISAVDWAMDKDEGLAKQDTIFKQNYSFPDAKAYFQKALVDKSRDNEYYGQAWRAVGETMHLVADMGTPAHVRNDGHGLGDADPLEGATSAATIEGNNNKNWTSSIDYNQGVQGLMQALAAYTNKNFFSKDTIPVTGKTNTANGRPVYPSPSIAGLTPDKSGYLEGKVDGVTVKMARQSVWYRWGLSKNKSYELDTAVIKDQQRMIIPTVVRAAEAVIERFIPRFEAKISAKPDPDIKGKYVISGGITQNSSPEWGTKLVIRNGAYVVVNGKKETVQLVNNDNLNEFTLTVSAKEGDKVKVVYDLGGLVVESTEIALSGLTIDPVTLKGETAKEYTFKAVTSSPPANPRYEWYVNGSLKQDNANSSYKTKFAQNGEYKITVKLKDGAGQEYGTADSKVTISGAQTPATGYWQYKGTWHSEIRKVDPIYTSQQWEVTTLTDGAISAVEKIRDNSVETKPWLEKIFDYTWSVSAKTGNYKDKLYPGDEVTVSMSLKYKGIDPKKLGGQARMYCGAFSKYPEDNFIQATNPGGAGTKTVSIPVVPGYGKGTAGYIKVHCEGGYQGIEFAYIYEWVPPSS
jgi:hypothetical protein